MHAADISIFISECREKEESQTCDLKRIMKRLVHVSYGICTFYPFNNPFFDFFKVISSLKKTLSYITTSDKTFVFGHRNDILFVFSGSKTESISYLRYQLQILPDIAVFLFGDYCKFMKAPQISNARAKVYGKYVDTFLQIIDSDPKYQLSIIPNESLFSNLSQFIYSKNPINPILQSDTFIECIFFRDHHVLSRFNNPNYSPLDSRSIFLLSLAENLQNYDTMDHPEFHIEMTDIHPLSCYLYINRVLTQCDIFVLCLSSTLHCTVLFVTLKNPGKPDDLKMQIADCINLLSSYLKEGLNMPPQPDFSVQISGLVYCLSINRTYGYSFDYEPFPDTQNHQITQLLLKTMKNHSFDGLFEGKNIMIWSDKNFLFFYMILFFDERTGDPLSYTKPIETPIFKDDANISHSSIASLYFSNKKVQIFEIYSIFLNTVSPIVAYKESLNLFHKMISTTPPKLLSVGEIKLSSFLS